MTGGVRRSARSCWHLRSSCCWPARGPKGLGLPGPRLLPPACWPQPAAASWLGTAAGAGRCAGPRTCRSCCTIAARRWQWRWWHACSAHGRAHPHPQPWLCLHACMHGLQQGLRHCSQVGGGAAAACAVRSARAPAAGPWLLPTSRFTRWARSLSRMKLRRRCRCCTLRGCSICRPHRARSATRLHGCRQHWSSREQ